MKKVLSLICTAVLLISSFVTSYAEEQQPNLQSTKVINELEIFSALLEKSNEELIQSGFTQQQITELRNFDIIHAIEERLKLSETELNHLGYEHSDIRKLNQALNDLTENSNKLYNMSNIEKMNLIKAQGVFAQMTLYTGLYNYSTSRLVVDFTWRWSNSPLTVIGKDALACAWQGTDNNGNLLNVAIDPSNSYQTIHETSNTGISRNVRYGFDVKQTYGAATSEFQLGYSYEGTNVYYDSAYGKVTFIKTGSQPINEIALNITYAHTYFGPVPALTFPGGFSISVGMGSENMSSVTARYKANGQVIRM